MTVKGPPVDKLGAVALLGIALLQLVLPDSPLFFVALHSVFGWSWVVALIGAIAAVLRRSMPLGLGAGGLWLTWAMHVLPGNGSPPPGTPVLRLVSANVLMANPRPSTDLAELSALNADVLMLQEYSPRWQQAASALTMHRFEQVQSDSFGIAMFSKTPLLSPQTFDAQGVSWMSAQIEVDGTQVQLITVHTLPPISSEYHRIWRAQLAQLQALMAQSEGPTIIAGDLNLTRHSPSFGALLATGFHTAHAECGQSMARTWPHGTGLEIVRPDHVFLSPELRCVALTHTRALGSDHRGVVVDLAWSGG